MIWRRKREPVDGTASDEALLSGGSEAALAELYRRHGGLVYRYSLRLLQNEAISEEVTQDVFVTMLEQRFQFEPNRGLLSTWLRGIARRLVWKRLRLQGRLIVDDELDEFESADGDPSAALTRKQAVEAVDRGIRNLPPHPREVIGLCEFEEMRYEDAAAVIGVPVGTVKSRLHRAKQKLASFLSEPQKQEERR
jgi:RNA polymerase sigma-70 factor (ECF subfamily)